MTRITLGKTARRVLAVLAEHGPTPLSHGARYAEIYAGQIRVMASTNHLLRANRMVEWAGGNHDRWTVRITDHGRECLRLGSHIPHGGGFVDSYGPRRDAELLSDADDWYSEGQLEEITLQGRRP